MSQPVTRATCRILRTEAEAALKAVAEKHGLVLSLGNGSFDPSTFNVKATFTVTSAGGVPADFARNCERFGLSAEDYGRTVITDDAYTIDGVNPRRPKYPVSVTRKRDGKRFKWTATYTKRALQAAA